MYIAYIGDYREFTARNDMSNVTQERLPPNVSFHVLTILKL